MQARRIPTVYTVVFSHMKTATDVPTLYATHYYKVLS